MTKQNADEVHYIEGVSSFSESNDYNCIFFLTKQTSKAKRLAIYLNVYDSNNSVDPYDEYFALESVIDVSIGNTKTRIHRSYSSIPYGRTELMTTTGNNISHVIGQIFLTGRFRNTTKIQIIEIHNSIRFERLSYIISKAFSFECSIVLFLFAFLLANNYSPIEPTQILALLLIASTTILLLLFNNYHTAFMHAVELFFKGETQSLTYLTLFAISTTYIPSSKTIPSLIIGVIFIISDGIFLLTSDSLVLARLFDSNYAIWMFFFAASIVFKITMLTMTMHHLIFAYFQASTSQKTNIFITIVILIIVALPKMISIAYVANENLSVSSISFLSDYIIQAVGAILIIGIVWPTIDFDASSGATIKRAKSQEDLVELFGSSQLLDL
ncbi:hypothetical protein TVAG_037060 [Trichomonas vaginalis G3]|uniref:Intimal thickness related receptor IRP domain-containing protein n=1 Tax=Trichomonas vaginalis (strain ATCC PRA-98 / G3) TaxID=412133 RepID=A2FH48_TRIV3|nr:hypothetical protein TVAGG3_0470260 [Trichomonas vaginalis G3]EAX95773.1 hypothetical protein TVAG_037060 [Trichomonas vaginalis G3]KAI5515008.1 hypothetical protein TVAGG3_0470260 [Trichomonas vaginalis G3]|eukprot:XP_001308703.1 hypothetical protein [Trichomonas vaginalis G3]